MHYHQRLPLGKPAGEAEGLQVAELSPSIDRLKSTRSRHMRRSKPVIPADRHSGLLFRAAVGARM
jgi:hypothetical protein